MHLKSFVLPVLLLIVACPALAQEPPEDRRPGAPGLEPLTPRSLFSGGFGLSHIEDDFGVTQTYFMVTLRPEFALGDVGVGIAADVRFNVTDASIRREDWETFSDVLSIIRYVRYGRKFTPGLYGRFGALDRAQLGFGQQMYLYNNEVTPDARRRGIELDYDFGPYGFESMWSNLANPEVLGLRAFYRPLHASPVPFVNRLQVGLSFSGDLEDRGGFVNRAAPGEPFVLDAIDPDQCPACPPHAVGHSDGAMMIAGLDIGLPITALPMLDVIPYVDAANMIGYGAGMAAGIQTTLQVPMLATFDARLENRFVSNRYLPAYFNAFYEIERLERVGMVELRDEEEQVTGTVPLYNSKRNRLQAAQSRSGWYGSLGATVLGWARVHGSYERLRREPNSGWLHIGTDIGVAGESPVIVRAAYDRWNIGSETDLFRIQDENALLTAEIGYQPMRYVLVSMVYQQSFSPIREGGEILGYERQSRVEPKVQLLVSF